MIVIRKSGDRGGVDLGWLQSRHTFSFGHYVDPEHMGVGPLRVINEDRVKPGAGFDTHGHRDMEIISYVFDGALEHRDSIGTGSVIRPGDVQRMSAGTGIRHSEYNHSQSVPVHFLQIWIEPETDGLAPSYEQKTFAGAETDGRLRLVGSRNGRDESITIHQDVDMHAGRFNDGETSRLHLSHGRCVWVHVASGNIEVNGALLLAGDGALISGVNAVEVEGRAGGEILVFDMPA